MEKNGIFNATQQILEYRSIMKMNQDLMEFIEETICLKK